MSVLSEIAAEVRVCTLCELSQSRTNAVPGTGPDDAEVFFIGEGPGWHEDQQGLPFVGASGKFLTELIGSPPDDLLWDDTHHLRGHGHVYGRELIVIAPRDDDHQTIVLTPEDWEMIELHGTFLEDNLLFQIRAIPNPTYAPAGVLAGAAS